MEPLKPSQCNAVQLDRIWIDHVHHEDKATVKWEENWGYLKGSYQQMAHDISQIQHRPRVSIAGVRKPVPLSLPPIIGGTRQVSAVPFVPLTTTGEVGWKKDHNLEYLGRFGRPKGSILKHLGWPLDALN